VLTIAMGNMGMPRSSMDSAIERAYRYSDRLPELERLKTTATYYMSGPHADRTKAIAAYEALIEKDETAAGNNIGTMWNSRRDYARAESVYAADIRKDSGSAISYGNMIEAQISHGKFKEAGAMLAIAVKRFPDNNTIRLRAPLLLYAQGRIADAERDLDTVGSNWDAVPRSEVKYWKSAFARIHGRYAEAKRLVRETSVAMESQGIPSVPVNDSLDVLAEDAWVHGPSERIVRAIDATLAAFPFRQIALVDRPYFRAASAYALAGRPDKGRAIIELYQREVTDTARLRLQAPGLHRALAEIALAERKPLVALTEFRRSDVRSDGYPADECGACPLFNVARAFDLAEMSDSAIATYERYLAMPYWAKPMDVDAFGLAGTHKRLGELYEARGERQKAVSHYTQFVELWKNADPDLQPKVAEVKQRLARLNDVERR
jgi:tetratricopeptide (TPR) repeat protein